VGDSGQMTVSFHLLVVFIIKCNIFIKKGLSGLSVGRTDWCSGSGYDLNPG
jgi:hypothetical protein